VGNLVRGCVLTAFRQRVGGNVCVLFVDVVLLGCGDGEHNGQSDLMRDDAQRREILIWVHFYKLNP